MNHSVQVGFRGGLDAPIACNPYRNKLFKFGTIADRLFKTLAAPNPLWTGLSELFTRS
jgi:hypothetical protein